MPKLVHKLPSYRRHTTSGQAMVCIAGKRIYLGKYDSPESREAYNRVVAEWVAGGRHAAVPDRAAESAASPNADVMKVAEVIAAFWDHAEAHYRKPDGTPTSELDNMRQALRPLRRLYAHTPAAGFGPKALKAVREHMVSLGWCRPHINKQVSRIKSVFRWAVENELVPAGVHHALAAVKGLQKGRTAAPEPDPVRPVPDDHVQAVRRFVSRQVWALVRLQLLTGARAGELIRLRPVDINTAGEVWTAEPADHKTPTGGTPAGSSSAPRPRPSSASSSPAAPSTPTCSARPRPRRRCGPGGGRRGGRPCPAGTCRGPTGRTTRGVSRRVGTPSAATSRPSSGRCTERSRRPSPSPAVGSRGNGGRGGRRRPSGKPASARRGGRNCGRGGRPTTGTRTGSATRPRRTCGRPTGWRRRRSSSATGP